MWSCCALGLNSCSHESLLSICTLGASRADSTTVSSKGSHTLNVTQGKLAASVHPSIDAARMIWLSQAADLEQIPDRHYLLHREPGLQCRCCGSTQTPTSCCWGPSTLASA